jgi:hypothetical protein
MSAYRDDLLAAHSQILELQRQLQGARARISQLEGRRSQDRGGRSDVERRRGRTICYERPWSYFPLWELLKAGVREAASHRLAPPSSDSLLTWVAYYVLALPAYYLLALPVYALVVLPYFACFTLLASPVVLIGLALSGLRLSSHGRSPKLRGRGFLGRRAADGAFFWIITISCSTAPLFVPVVLWACSLL